MSHSIETLLLRNLHGVFGEGDPALRLATAKEIFTPDATFYEPAGIHQGPEDIARIAGKIRATHPDFRYTPLGVTEELHGKAGRLRWVSGALGQPPAYAGTDVITVRDGKIEAVYLFFDPIPA